MGEKRLSADAIALLRKAVARAQAIPEGFAMEWWAHSSNSISSDSFDEQGFDYVEKPQPFCGVVGCLAFEIVVAAGGDPEQVLAAEKGGSDMPMANHAAQLLGLNPETEWYHNSPLWQLFTGEAAGWPVALSVRYLAAEPFSKARAEVLGEAVEMWIAGDGSFEPADSDES